MIYADNAATTKLDIDAFEAMKPWLLDEYGNASQPYSFARKPKKALAEAREIVAACINAKPEEIYFTSGGTESDNWAIKSAAFSNMEHKAIITSAFEHHAILHSCTAIERMGCPVVYLFPDGSGQIQSRELRSHITNRTRLVSIMFANNELGSIQPVQELAEEAHKNGAVFHTDAVQAVGHVPIDVKDLGVDLLSASAHKFNGPKGIGFLYRRDGLDFPPYMDGGAQEKHLRAGTENIASIVGMAVALKKNCDDLIKNQAYLKELEEVLLVSIEKAGLRFVRNGGNYTLPGLLSLSFPGFSGEAILHRMDLMGICISTGSACDSVNTEISHVLKAIKLDEELARGTIRISLGKHNTINDVEAIANALVKITRKD
ncbi:MAG: cysteine desulfurase family protein [Bacteroidaceae bacterium]|nr:cysteine desulfurase family protein [Bacteroidaceae bacterium]